MGMESLGKTTNVTETSALIEQLIRAEAGAVPAEGATPPVEDL